MKRPAILGFLALVASAAPFLQASPSWRTTRQFEKGFTRHRVIPNPGNEKLIPAGGRYYGKKAFMPYGWQPRYRPAAGYLLGTPVTGQAEVAREPVKQAIDVQQNQKIEQLEEQVQELQEQFQETH